DCFVGASFGARFRISLPSRNDAVIEDKTLPVMETVEPIPATESTIRQNVELLNCRTDLDLEPAVRQFHNKEHPTTKLLKSKKANDQNHQSTGHRGSRFYRVQPH